MSSIQQLVDNLGTGWKLVGNGTPVEDTAVVSIPDPSGIGSTTQNRGTGKYYVTVQDPDGHQRALFLKAQPIKGGLVVRQSGVNDIAVDAAGTPDPKGKAPTNLFDGDLKNLQWDQGGPVGDVPQKPDKPSATGDLDRLKDGKVIPPGDTTTVPDQLRDPKTGTTVNVPKDPAGTVTPVGDNFYVIKPDGSSTLVTDASGKAVAKTKENSQFNVPGIGLVDYDPKTGTATTLIKTPTNIQAKDLAPQKINGKIYVAGDDSKGGIVWQEAKDEQGNPLAADTTYTVAAGGNDARSPNITLIDAQGNTKTIKKEGWTPPPNPQAGTAVTPDTQSPFVVTIGDNGAPVFTKNNNQLSINDAQKQLIQQLGLKVADGSISEKAAQDIITNATQSMTAQAQMLSAQAAQQNAQANVLQGGVTAAGNILTGAQQGAQTGAGLLQNRVTAATGALQNLVGLGANAKNLMSAPAGLGEQLVGGLQGWATELGGGQGVYDAAANLVKSADPNNQSGMASQGYAALQQMLQKYQDLTGQQHPATALPQAQGGLNAPPPGFNAPTTAQIANQAAAGQQLQAATSPFNAPFGAIGNNPMLAAVQANNRLQAGQQLQAATAQAGLPFGAIGANPMANFVAPTTVMPTAPTVVA